jgi:signal transduction histidine kinase
LNDIAEVLRGLPYFSDLPQALLDQVCRKSEKVRFDAGTMIIEEDSLSEDMFVIVDGELTVTKKGSDREVTLASLGPGEVVGEIALLDNAPRTASVTTATPATLIRIPANAFEDLIQDSRVIHRMFRTVTSRLRGIEDTLRHEERMAALGRMAAQLMHELNNPAAAVGRSMARAEEVYLDLGEATIQLAGIAGLMDGAIPVPDKPESLDPLSRSTLEEEVMGWLSELGVPDTGELGAALVADGWDRDLLQETVSGLDRDTATRFTRWLGLRVLASQLIGEVRIAAGRISELVRVVKNYSYLDQGPVQRIDPTEGIRDTLILLKHKLRGIETVVDIEPGLPQIEASGRDLNQVWTNLIDNAADAMDGSGRLVIEASRADDVVVVRVSDTGPGIDPEVMNRIFDPFFTTKAPGQGTGLGLHTVHTIVNRTGGDIKAESGPDGTTFIITFPVV